MCILPFRSDLIDHERGRTTFSFSGRAPVFSLLLLCLLFIILPNVAQSRHF